LPIAFFLNYVFFLKVGKNRGGETNFNGRNERLKRLRMKNENGRTFYLKKYFLCTNYNSLQKKNIVTRIKKSNLH